ncbi:MAG: PDZ domain-containing protein [candidate division KSB1 bacterium]|nr:PDZ domain-containing protein [candidate division KSB1 bacterium]
MSRRVWLSLALVGLLCAQAGAATTALVTKTKESRRAWMGVYVRKLDQEQREELGIKERRGVVIERVAPDSPAEKAGLEEDDVILKVDGKEVKGPDELVAAVKAKRPGDKIKVEYVREGRRHEAEVVLARAPRVTERVVIRPFPRLEGRVWGEEAWLGVQLQELNASLAEYFGVKEDEGVLVTEVKERSPADKAGLRPGDVITRLDEEQVSDVEDIAEVLSDKEPGDSVVVAYVRKGVRSQTTVKLGRKARVRVFERGGPGLWWWEGEPRRELFFHFPDEPALRFEFDPDDLGTWRERVRLWSEKALEDLQRGLEELRVKAKERQQHLI